MAIREEFEAALSAEDPTANFRPRLGNDGTFLGYFYGCTDCKWEGWKLREESLALKVKTLQEAVDVLAQHIYDEL